LVQFVTKDDAVELRGTKAQVSASIIDLVAGLSK